MDSVHLLAAILCMSIVSLASADYDPCIRDGQYNTYYPGDCDKYYECNDGKATVKSCGWFHRFDEKSNMCKFKLLIIGNVDCSRASHTPTTTTTPTTGSSSSTAGTTVTSTKQIQTTPHTTKSGTTGTTTSGTVTTPTTTNSNNDGSSTTAKPNSASFTEMNLMLTTLMSILLALKYSY